MIYDGEWRLVWCAEMKSIDELRSSVSQLYSQLNVEEYQLQREHELQCQLADLQRQIEPFEQVPALFMSLQTVHTARCADIIDLILLILFCPTVFLVLVCTCVD